VYGWAKAEIFDCLFWELFHSTSVTSEWWERAGAVGGRGRGRGKMRFTCEDLVRERGWLCSTLSKPWGRQNA